MNISFQALPSADHAVIHCRWMIVAGVLFVVLPPFAGLQAAEPDARSEAAPGSSIHYIDRMNPPMKGVRHAMLSGVSQVAPSRLDAERGPYGLMAEESGPAVAGAQAQPRSGLKLSAWLQAPDLEQEIRNKWNAIYYLSLKKGAEPFDASAFHYLSFWVRGEKGGEEFQMGIIDRRREDIGGWLESGPLNAYAQRGDIDTDWQKVKIPLDIFKADVQELVQVGFLFGMGLLSSGEPCVETVYIDDLAFE